MVAILLLLRLLFVSGALAACSYKKFCITAPQMIEALHGSCLQIPCNFSFQPTQDFAGKNIGVWIKGDPRFETFPQNVIFNGSRTENDPVKIIGNLSQKNCTSVFNNLNKTYTDKFFFRVERQNFRATAVCCPLQINVTDIPPRPRIEMSGDLKEGKSLTMTCSAPTPCPHSPPKLTWGHKEQPHNNIHVNADGTLTTEIKRNITLSDKYDGCNITCSAIYPVNGGKHVETTPVKVTLNISYAPKDTMASISSSLSADGWVNLTCTSRANPPVNHFIWFKVNPDGATNVSEGVVYRVSATDGGVYFCKATNALGCQKSPKLHLNVKEHLRWEPVLGGIAGIVCLICLIICVWYLRSTHPTIQQTQSQTGEELVIQNSGTKTEEEIIHYSEINFSKQRAGLSSDSLWDGGQQQDTVYAQVKVSKTGNSSTQAPDNQ
ncbi:sialic acid-binding Ig-like lectin 13 [Paralichthys olivaceus]|uniref:sialic acid-binding Ig-like lectin 13 n=1 Tax=Paralichthys olivaceus TaxID=8255 RepID=UPI0037522F8A